MKRQNRRIIVIVVIIAAFFALLASLPPGPPGELTALKIAETRSGLLYDYEITRIPSVTETIYMQQSEEVVIGFSLDDNNMNFGTIPSGGSMGRRSFALHNKAGDARVHLSAHGEAAPFVSFSRNDFVLKADESAEIEVTFTSGPASGNYTGEIDIMIQRPRLSFLPV